jgi:hypothetical protein
MNKNILALAALGLASSISDAPYIPEPKYINPNPYRHKQCKSCKAFKHCNINKYNDPKQQACANYSKRK